MFCTLNLAPPFCKCYFPEFETMPKIMGNIPNLITCRCGEESSSPLEWMWSESESDVLIEGVDITFHPIYSQGTAVVRGDKPLESGKVHFWEIRVLTSLTGTDVMFGICTDQFDMEMFDRIFCSAIGMDTNSWGLSYNGDKRHGGVSYQYGPKFSGGTLVGLYLDLTHGFLEYFINRQSLGIAFVDIPTDSSTRIYPIVCSTAAKTAIRLVNCTSVPDCLQLRAFKTIVAYPALVKELKQIPGFREIFKPYWFCLRLSPTIDLGDLAVLPGCHYSQLQSYNDDDDETDIYHNKKDVVVRFCKDNSDDESNHIDIYDMSF